MATLQLKLGTAPQKYGVVTVLNTDGTLNRQFKITGDEYRALGLKNVGPPPGVTMAEWTAKRSNRPLAFAVGKDFDVGDVEVRKDGSLLMKVAEVFENGQFVEDYLRLLPGQWSGTIPDITVTSNELLLSDKSRMKRCQVTRIQNGVVECQ